MPTVFYWVCRPSVGVVLVASALGKSLDLPGFIDVLTTYRAFPDGTLWPIGILVTVVEWVLGIWLVSGWRLYTGTLAALILNTGYAVWMTISLLRGLALDNCGCYSRFFPQPLRWYSPLEYLALAGMCYALTKFVGRRLNTH
jgi:uncharacterized membrane protein YphA (DoxX/SURF4 family)